MLLGNRGVGPALAIVPAIAALAGHGVITALSLADCGISSADPLIELRHAVVAVPSISKVVRSRAISVGVCQLIN